MDPQFHCRQCKAPLTSEAREGLCPRCLFLALPVKAAEQALESLALADKPPLRCFGEYDLLEEVGRGGMGVVYKACQRSLNRHVAVKMLAPGVEPSPEFVARLRSEAAAAAALHHPNIVAVHEVGVWEKQHYFAMDFIAGPSLATLAPNQPLPARRAAGYLQKISEAVHHAHEHGILHRDLKPSNILIDADDQPHVTDFGLARRLVGDPQVTQKGQVLGSPPYMPPEQIHGEGGKLSRCTDIYALGAMLYQLLTGRPPFVASELTQLMRLVLETEPVPPRLINPSVPRDLETICLKCLEKDPAKRYSTAEGLAEELQRFLDDRAILARPVGMPGKSWRWCRRNPRLFLVTAGLALALLALLAQVAWSWRRTTVQLARQRVMTYASDIRATQIALDQGNRGQAVDLLRRHLPQPRQSDLRGIEWRYLWQAARSHHLQVLDQEAMVSGLAFGADGTVVTTGMAGETRIWDERSGRIIRRMPGAPLPILVHQGNAVSQATGSLATLATNGFAIQRWPHLETIAVLPGAFPPMEFSHDGRWLATGGTQDQIQLWTTDRWEPRPIATYPRVDPPYLTLRFSPDDRDLLWCSPAARTISVRDLSSDGRVRELNGLMDMTSLAVSPDKRWVAVGNWPGQVRILEYATGGVVTNWLPHPSLVSGLAFSPNNQVLATGGNDQVVRLWRAGSWRLVATLTGNESEIWDIVFAPDGQTLWTTCKDGTIRQFPACTPSSPERAVLLPTNSVIRVLSARGDRALVSQTTDLFAIAELNTVTLASKPLVTVPKCDVVRVSQLPEVLSIALTNGETILVRTDETPAVIRFQLPSSTAKLLARSPDRRKFLVQDLNGTQLAGPLFTWDVISGRLDSELGVAPAYIDAAFSPDGKFVACVDDVSSEPVIWDLVSRQQRFVLRGHRWKLYAVSFSPDGRLLATGSCDGTARLWDVSTGRSLAVLKGHRSGVNRVEFTADGRTLLTVGDEADFAFWNVAAGQEMLRVQRVYQHLARYISYLPRISSDNQVILFGPFLSDPGESAGLEPLRRYVLTPIPTLAEIDAAH